MRKQKTAQEIMQGTVLEKDFTKQVIELAHVYHWKVAHFRAAMTQYGWRTPVQADGAGFPDLVLARDGKVIFAELKAEKGKLSPEQEAWQQILPSFYVWRPSDFETNIMQVLKGE